MVACPYDQLFIDPNTHTAEKCNFCANRIENELLPACVSVCPTECRIFGDLDDPSSEVARIAQLEAVSVRKPEKGTIPKVFYIGAEESAIQPETAVRPFLYKEGQVLLRPLGSPAPDASRPGDARVDYDTPHVQPWGLDMAIYLLTKGIATGTMLVSLLLPLVAGTTSTLTTIAGPAISLAFLVLTAIILVADLERPERFLYILTRPNWHSWMVWGAYFLTAQGALTTLWLLAALAGLPSVLSVLRWPLVITSLLTTIYTGFLFAQGLARDLWQGPQSTIDLLVQAVAEGAAALLVASAVPGVAAGGGLTSALAGTLAIALAVHVVLILFENVLAPSPTRHHELATKADPPRRLCAALLGRRDRGDARGHRCGRHLAARTAAARRGRHRRARRQLRLGIHMDSGRTERPAFLNTGKPGRQDGRNGRTDGSNPRSEGSAHSFLPSHLLSGLRAFRPFLPAILPSCLLSGFSMTRFRSHPDPKEWDDYVDYESTSWPKKEKRRYWIVPSICFNCESACGILAYVDKQTLSVRKIEGNPVHPGSRGRTCAKGVVTPNQLDDPDRILYPLKRDGERGSGKWRQVSWTEALDDIA